VLRTHSFIHLILRDFPVSSAVPGAGDIAVNTLVGHTDCEQIDNKTVGIRGDITTTGKIKGGKEGREKVAYWGDSCGNY
jgi:hypothetical protein